MAIGTEESFDIFHRLYPLLKKRVVSNIEGQTNCLAKYLNGLICHDFKLPLLPSIYTIII